MKTTVDRVEFAKAVAWVARAAKGDVAIVSSIEIEASAKRVMLTAGNETTTLRAAVGCDTDEPGRALVNAAHLADFLGRIRGDHDDRLDLVTQETSLEVTGARVSASYPLMRLQDLPTRPDVSGTPRGSVDIEALSAAISRVVTVCDPTPNIDWTYGLHLLGTKAGITVTGGHRYSLGRTRIENGPTDLDVLIPLGVVEMLRDVSGVATLMATDTLLRLATTSRMIICPLLPARMPDVMDDLVDTRNEVSYVVERNTLLDACRLVASGSDRVVITSDTDRLTMTTLTPEKGGESRSLIDTSIDIVDGQPSVMRVALKYLSPMLASMRPGPITVEVDPQVKPARIDDGRTRFIIMPIRPAKQTA